MDTATLLRSLTLALALVTWLTSAGCDPPELKASTPPARAWLAPAHAALSASLQAHRGRLARVHARLTAREHVTRGLGEGLTAARQAPRPLGRVALIGDSMAGRLTRPLRARVEASGLELVSLFEVNDALHNWKRTRLERLRAGLAAESPDTVILVMGTNDFLHPKVDELTSTIQAIEAEVAPRLCYWVGPPRLWARDTGIVELLAKTTHHCAHLDSEPLSIDRGHDGWHPSQEGAAQWADAIWSWVEATPIPWGHPNGAATP